MNQKVVYSTSISYLPVIHGQEKQAIKGSIDWFHQTIRNEPIRKSVYNAYSKTEHKLSDTINNDEGINSKSVSRKDLDKIAQESKNQKSKAVGHGVTADNVMRTEYM